MKPLTAVIVLAFLLSACAGQRPQTVDQYQSGDEQKSCNILAAEISGIENSIHLKYRQLKSINTSNTAIAVVGGLLFWPALFAIDTKSDPAAEINALLNRRSMLRGIMLDKGCSPNYLGIPTNQMFLESINKKNPSKIQNTSGSNNHSPNFDGTHSQFEDGK